MGMFQNIPEQLAKNMRTVFNIGDFFFGCVEIYWKIFVQNIRRVSKHTCTDIIYCFV